MPEDVAHSLDRLCSGLPDTRWTDQESFHLTLRFIGEVEPAAFFEIGELLAGVSLPPFELELAGLGQFPPRGPLRQLWVGVAASPNLDRLRRRVEACMHEAGIPSERRKFIPHVTLARFRVPPPEGRLASYLRRNSLFRLQPFPVSAFNLYSSHLRSDGAEHVIEAEYNFVTGVMNRQ